MKRYLKFILAGFVALAALNYFLLLIENAGHALFALTPLSPVVSNFYDSTQTIDINLFKQGGAGLSLITQGYGHTPFAGQYPGNWHDGIDLAANYGTKIYSVTGGTVIATGNQDSFCWHRAFGKYIAIKTADDQRVVWYAHLGNINITTGQKVTPETLLGTVGETGFETGPHLHLSIFEANGFTMTPRNGCGPMPTGKDIDPIPYLKML